MKEKYENQPAETCRDQIDPTRKEALANVQSKDREDETRKSDPSHGKQESAVQLDDQARQLVDRSREEVLTLHSLTLKIHLRSNYEDVVMKHLKGRALKHLDNPKELKTQWRLILLERISEPLMGSIWKNSPCCVLPESLDEAGMKLHGDGKGMTRGMLAEILYEINDKERDQDKLHSLKRGSEAYDRQWGFISRQTEKYRAATKRHLEAFMTFGLVEEKGKRLLATPLLRSVVIELGKSNTTELSYALGMLGDDTGVQHADNSDDNNKGDDK